MSSMSQQPSIGTVLDSGLCVGCGACALAAPDEFAVSMTRAGQFAARPLSTATGHELAGICPMSGAARDETEIAAALYPDLPVSDEIGRYREIRAAAVTVSDFREKGGSGGMGSWIATELMRRGDIDAVVHVQACDPDTNDGLLFRYQISHSLEEIRSGAKSRYYPVTLAEVLPEIVATDRRYGVVGLPCFIKAIRLLEAEGNIPPGRIVHTIGLVCGHLKSRYFADYLARQKGAGPDEVVAFDFRHKLAGRAASDYGFSFRRRGEEETVIAPMGTVAARDWGEGQFKYPACEFCDDVIAECADVVIGDAWLPQYRTDFRGTNIVLTRSERIEEIVAEGIAQGAVTADSLGVSDLVASQSSGLRHRREGLAHRLAVRRARGLWTPKKRVAPHRAPSLSRRIIYGLRQRLAETTSLQYARIVETGAPISTYRRRIAGMLLPYQLVARVVPGLQRRFRRLIRR